MARSITGWKLHKSDRDALLARFAARYERVIADHVTLQSGTDGETPLPSADHGKIVGEADDEAGVQALVVSIDGATERGDGSHFHITWSLGSKREAKESNDVIKTQGWRSVAPPVPIRLQLALWPA